MHTRRSGLALVLVLVLVGAGCGLFESNDDELETLRAELVQLREDVLDLETEVALLAVSPPTIAASVPTVTTTTRPEVSSSSSSVSATTTTTSAWSAGEPSATEVSETEVGLILTAVYGWGPSSTAEALQTVLGIVADGWYGNQTRSAHLAALEARGLPTDGVPVPPTTTTEAPAEGEATTEVPAEATTTTEVPAEATTTTTLAGSGSGGRLPETQVTVTDTKWCPSAPSGAGSTGTEGWTVPSFPMARTTMLCRPGSAVHRNSHCTQASLPTVSPSSQACHGSPSTDTSTRATPDMGDQATPATGCVPAATRPPLGTSIREAILIGASLAQPRGIQ